jgi:3-oxoacyl-(acyl-carrier-protein) synthase
MTVATGGSSGLEAIGSAALAIRTGCVDAVLAGGVEELSPESLRAFDEVGLLSRSGEDPRPFDEKSTGLSLSESAALVLLEELDSARLRGTRVMAEVRGHGSAFDTSRRRDERHSVRSIIRFVWRSRKLVSARMILTSFVRPPTEWHESIDMRRLRSPACSSRERMCHR